MMSVSYSITRVVLLIQSKTLYLDSSLSVSCASSPKEIKERRISNSLHPKINSMRLRVTAKNSSRRDSPRVSP